MIRRVRTLLLSLMLLLPASVAVGEEGGGAMQYQLKAVFLYNFTQFIEWPAGAYTSADEPFKIGVYGPNVFGNYLEEAVGNERVSGHRIRIVPVSSPAEALSCHMLFINSKTANIPALLAQLRGHILTVSDAEGFCSTGGMIGLSNAKNKIRIQINEEAVKTSNLRISSKLLRLAEVVSKK